jgi:hypothetical protein
MKALLIRTYYPLFTKGIFLCIENDMVVFQCYTLELPDLDNECKISCIPEKTYIVEKITSPKFNLCFYLNDVPGRTGILIHKGNYVTGTSIDTLGCILPGLTFSDINDDQFIDIAESVKAMNKLLKILPSSFKLTIRSF